jgi:hypothetical protein
MAIGSWLTGHTYNRLGTYAPVLMFAHLLNIANNLAISEVHAIHSPRAAKRNTFSSEQWPRPSSNHAIYVTITTRRRT